MPEEERKFISQAADGTPEGDRERVVELLNNFVFQRFARGFEIYQEIVSEYKEQGRDFSEIKKRMSRVWDNLHAFSHKYKNKGYKFKEFIEEQIEKSEEGSFLAEDLAVGLIVMKMDQDLFAETPHGEGESTDEYTTYVNEVVSYTWAVEDYVKLDVSVANLSSRDVFVKIAEGFKKVASALKIEEMKGVKRVQMTSWLLSKDFELKIRELFSRIPVESLNFEDENYGPAQDEALNFNGRSLQKFLLTGKKPETRNLEMSKEDFIRNFDS
jgi:hypothetical protein